MPVRISAAARRGGPGLDDPDWEPLWAVAQEHDLTVIIHSFTMTVPYPHGVWDTWDNVFLQRSAGHVWNAQRNMASLSETAERKLVWDNAARCYRRYGARSAAR